AVYEKFPAGSGGRGDDAIVDAVIVGEGLGADKGFFAGAIGGHDVDEDDIVIDGERGDGRTIGPDEIVLAPAFAITLESEIGVVGDDVAVDELDALFDERVG